VANQRRLGRHHPFIYDGDRLIEEYDGAGNRPRVYVHGSGADEPLVLYELTGGPVHRFYDAAPSAAGDAAASATGRSPAARPSLAAAPLI